VKLKNTLPAALKYEAVIIQNAAQEAGLDSFEVIFELLDARDVNGIASYGGFPVRYPSWRFGMEYERLEKGYTWGLSKIYELVINNDPTYAYLVRSNSLLEQKLVMAHVYGHADFFKHNVWFAPTDRHMVDTMGDHATRLRRYIDAFGQEEVERHLDDVLSIETLIDPYLPLREFTTRPASTPQYTPLSERARLSLEALTASPLNRATEARTEAGTGVRLPTYDVLGFLAARAPLPSWQSDVLRIVRREAYYFAPQRMTKIMNEGWASYWHSRLLTGGLLGPSEILDFADTHSGATAVAGGQLNPYKLGIELFRHAESRGRDLFRLRRVHNDVSLIDELADEEFVERHLRPALPPLVVSGTDDAPREASWSALKARVLRDMSWGGLPQIELVSVDAKGEGELLLVHRHDGRDLQLAQTGETLKHLARIWKGPVHLLTLEEGQGRLVVCDGEEVTALDTVEAERACLSGDDAA